MPEAEKKSEVTTILGVCECSDPGCRACRGECTESATVECWPVECWPKEFEVFISAKFCSGCADDALDSGLWS